MRSRIAFFSFLLLITLGFSACDSYSKLLKSNDMEKKYTAAIDYYKKKDYYKAGMLLDELLVSFKGDPRFEDVYFRYAYCKYGNNELIMASYHFKNFYESFPNSKNSEEALFMHVYCDYLDTYPYYLDPSVTRLAMDNLQLFINVYPMSEHIPECNKYMDELRSRLRKKSLESGRLYMKMEDYQAAILAFSNTIKDYPELENKDEIEMTLIKCQYMMALNSVDSKKAARMYEVKTRYQEFVRTFGQSNEYHKQALYYYSRSVSALNNMALQAGYTKMFNEKYVEAANVFKKQQTGNGVENQDQLQYLVVKAWYKAGRKNENPDYYRQAIDEANLFLEQYGNKHSYTKKVVKYKTKAEKALK